ncbi:SDR family oxidoreductase [Paraburkholderia unamae]|uniref:3(Or 17)beta-hydroxysteroid dehydrogenase n=1 Tax=Paraburkholderia unamae TaxID=219649 RepID=A0ABX5KP45_9BURK|nr:SDR family oxidoreductase [Paraburkholderia unamae]PVX81260.1 3(or 17)beta-hydroxysteroid dehydrogenase [Paraburkholderia unamae]
MARLQGKVALVTGAASGLGSAIALAFAREGARVVLTDIDAQAGEAMARRIGEAAFFVAHDVTKEDDWARAIAATHERFGALNVLVNNAGILKQGTIEQASFEQWQQVLHVNAGSCFLGCRYGIAAMKEHGGSIVNIASVSSWLPIDGYAAYGASKAAVASLTRSSALHCRKNGYAIRVNSVHPDGIYTPMMQASAPGVDPKYLLFDKDRNRGGRACPPEDIANIVLFLASDESRQISGAQMQADNAILGMGL